MGSATTPLSLRGDYGRTLLSELERISKESIARSGEIDIALLTQAIDSALDDLRQRDEVLHFLAAYLGRCLTGSIPDLRRWEPPA